MVAYTDFLTTDSLSQYEDSDKYTKEWVPLIEKYRLCLLYTSRCV